MTHSLQVEKLGFFTTIVAPVAVYVSLAAGAGNPIRCDHGTCANSPQYLLFTLVLLLCVPFSRAIPRLAIQLFFMTCLLLLLLICAQASALPAFVYGKAFGGVIASAFVLIFSNHLLKAGGVDGFAKGITRVLCFVLMLTFVYKAQFDVFDRDVPYLLNGPIIFGWLMGWGALCALHLSIKHGTWAWGLCAIALLGGVVWSASKGPVLAYTICALLLLISGKQRKGKRLLLTIGITAALVLAGYFLDIHTLIMETRFGLILQITSAGIDFTEGSVGVRASTYEKALVLIGQHFPWGIGPGNFMLYDVYLMYPHNVHLEVMLEYGLLPFLVYVGAIAYALTRNAPLFCSLILFGLICMSFSGDVSYMRFMLPLLFLQTATNKKIYRLVPGRERSSAAVLQT